MSKALNPLDPMHVGDRGGAVDKAALHELELYIENSRELLSQREAIARNLARKMKSGKFNTALAPKLLRYLVDNAAMAYGKEYAGGEKEGLRMFNTATRQALAVDQAKQFEREIQQGEWDHVLTSRTRLADDEQNRMHYGNIAMSVDVKPLRLKGDAARIAAQVLEEIGYVWKEGGGLTFLRVGRGRYKVLRVGVPSWHHNGRQVGVGAEDFTFRFSHLKLARYSKPNDVLTTNDSVFEHHVNDVLRRCINLTVGGDRRQFINFT